MLRTECETRDDGVETGKKTNGVTRTQPQAGCERISHPCLVNSSSSSSCSVRGMAQKWPSAYNQLRRIRSRKVQARRTPQADVAGLTVHPVSSSDS